MVAREAEFDPGVLPRSATARSFKVLSGAFHGRGDETNPDASMIWFTAPADGELLTAIETGGVRLNAMD